MRRRFFSFVCICLCALSVVAAGRKVHHFLNDRSYRNTVHSDFLKRKPLIVKAVPEIDKYIARLTAEQSEAMEFLYAYMPLNDVADYGFDFFCQQVDYAFRARKEMPWGTIVPDDVFRHFVLPYRVNNENLDSARMVLYPILRERLKGMSMYDAALEVNHWCHEWVTYRPADIRTSAPLATMRTGLGRCGEESTFTVTALRAAGIPARQCYTPRWAHCDDNHAWVEVWIDGEWKFIGACEPDPELNMGWFSIPSTRCMMVHTKAFGRYEGEEQTIVEKTNYSELNLLNHYTPTRRLRVMVEDSYGRAVKGAQVRFKLYNYSEYYTLSTSFTDKNGMAEGISGNGDLLVWATDGICYNYSKVDLRTDSMVTIRLTRTAGKAYVDELDITVPVATKAKVFPQKHKVITNAYRLAYEDSVRNARVSHFVCNLPREQWGVLPNANLTENQIREIITKSEGNHEEIIKFLNKHTKDVDGVYLYDYLKSFSDKDMRDISAATLEHHLTSYNGSVPLDVYKRGLMPARISNEAIVPWRNLKPYTPPRIDNEDNYYDCPITPIGVEKLNIADTHSRNIYFVASCRANNQPAYLDNATNIVYVWNKDRWQTADLDSPLSSDTGRQATLVLNYTGSEPTVPQYYTHFTLQKFEDGDFVSFDFESDPRFCNYPVTLNLPAGYYCLSTGNRYPNGDVLSRMDFFTLDVGQQITKEITLRELCADRATPLPSVSPEMKLTADSILLANYAGTKGMLFVNLGDYREPSRHFVNEMLQLKDEFSRWGGNILCLAPADARSVISTFETADIIDYDSNEVMPLQAALTHVLQLDAQPRYPFAVFVTNTGQILYYTEGYSIGSVEQILKVAKRF